MQLVTIFVLLTISVCVCHGWLYRSFFRGLKRVSDAQPVPTRKGNIALRKRAQQDSTISYGIATLAVDGNRNGLYTVGNSCTHTRLKGPHFWTVDLQHSYSVGDIRITNRRDCCTNRLKNLEIYLRSDKAVKERGGNRRYRCAVYEGPPKKGQQSITISCGGRSGRYLSILKKNGYLTLCEVEVFKTKPYRRRPQFVMIQGKRNFDESKRKCEELGMKIAVIRNQLEQQAAAKATRVKDHPGCVRRGNLGGCRAFIGYKRVYRWIGGTSSFKYFHKKEPNNNENCVEVNYYGQAKAKWSDVSCKKKLSVLCVRP